MTTLLFREDAYARDCAATVTAVDERGIQLDRTVFYPTGGGQPGDTGVLRSALGDIPIAGTIKGDGPDAVIHVPPRAPGSPAAGEAVTAAIDWDRATG
jgi:misacylated tRNA(Ala) deacylase